MHGVISLIQHSCSKGAMEKENSPPTNYSSQAESYQQPTYSQPGHAPPAYEAQGYQRPPGYQPVPLHKTELEAKAGSGLKPNILIITEPSEVVIHAKHQKSASATGAIALSCFVTWCCCLPFGCIAFVYAVLVGRQTPEEGERYLRIAKAFNTAGIICGVMICLTFAYVLIM